MKKHLALMVVVASVVLVVFLMVSGLGSQASAPDVAPLDVVINEVGWSGTACSSYDEWIELYNNTDTPINLTGWTLAAADGTPNIVLNGSIPARGYFLLERADDNTISDIAADQIYGSNGSSWAMKDTGEELELRDGSSSLIDSANGDSGAWPHGTNNPDHSMERIDPVTPDSDANWDTNDGIVRNGLDCNGDPLNGTPKAQNSAFVPPSANLSVDKRGPASTPPGALVTYTVVLSNAGQFPAEAAWLTDVLPAQVEFVTHTAPYPFDQPVAGTLIWDLGVVPTTTAATPVTFTITGQVDGAALGELTNVITLTSATTDSSPADNHDTVVTVVGSGPVTPVVLLESLYYDGYEPGDIDEALRVINVSTVTAYIGEWQVTDGSATLAFPPGTTLAPGQTVWCARDAAAFERQFGFKPDFETGDTDPAVPELDGAWPGFANTGDECLLKNELDETIDTLVYEGGDTSVAGWSGDAVQPYNPSSTFPSEGQILYRKRDQRTGLPVPDTDTAADWAQEPGDAIDGRKVQYPGWDPDDFFWTARVTETAALTIAVGPDNLLDAVLVQIERAEENIWIEGYTFESAALAQALTESLKAGVGVTLLLEAGPAGGIDGAQRWICNEIQNAGGRIYFMSSAQSHARYRNQHGKFMLIDGRLALIGSENLNPTSMPADDKSDGTAGRRGVYLITDAPGVAARVRAIMRADIDPTHHGDVVTCAEAPDLCIGSPPLPEPNWTSYTLAFTEPRTVQGVFAFEVIQSPDNSLRDRDSLLGLLRRAGPGDTVRVELFYEHPHWGPGDSTPEADPNPRLEAYLAAARQGATVRILLDGYFDTGGHNTASMAYLRDIAHQENLDLQVRLANPAGLGLHNKMVLAEIGSKGYLHVGSINGSEASSKVNRELALQVQSDEAHAYLKTVFDHDWSSAKLRVHLPLVAKQYEPPQPAEHLLISEAYYGTIPEKEWVEIYNPTNQPVDLSAYKIGDALNPDDYEGTYQFPPGATLQPYTLLVVAVTASGFQEAFPSRSPDFEMLDTDPTVPDLLKYSAIGTGDWALGNAGDEVLLRGGDDQPVDVLVYGSGDYPGVVPHPGVESGHSLERVPIWFDTDDCSADFRDWPYPSPGEQP